MISERGEVQQRSLESPLPAVNRHHSDCRHQNPLLLLPCPALSLVLAASAMDGHYCGACTGDGQYPVLARV